MSKPATAPSLVWETGPDSLPGSLHSVPILRRHWPLTSVLELPCFFACCTVQCTLWQSCFRQEVWCHWCVSLPLYECWTYILHTGRQYSLALIQHVWWVSNVVATCSWNSTQGAVKWAWVQLAALLSLSGFAPYEVYISVLYSSHSCNITGGTVAWHHGRLKCDVGSRQENEWQCTNWDHTTPLHIWQHQRFWMKPWHPVFFSLCLSVSLPLSVCLCVSHYLVFLLASCTGVTLISLALCADAVIGNLQEKTMKAFQSSNSEMVGGALLCQCKPFSPVHGTESHVDATLSVTVCKEYS